MDVLWERIKGEPALFSGAVMAVLNLPVAFGAWGATPEQLGAINGTLAAVLAFAVRQSVQPTAGTPLRRRRHAPAHAAAHAGS